MMKMGPKFRLSYHIKPASILSGINYDINLLIGKWCKTKKITKESFLNWMKLILTSAPNNIFKIHSNKSKKIQYFIMLI
jgi:hypothetical protein